MEMRLYQRKDLNQVIDLFYHAVHEVQCNDYTEEERDAIAPKNVDRYHWEASLEKNHTLIVEDEGKIIAFGNIGTTGYLDRLYIDKKYLHQGIGAKLLERLEQYAKKQGNSIIYVTSSITSKPFFEKHGYEEIEEQINVRRGVRILRYLMEKKI